MLCGVGGKLGTNKHDKKLLILDEEIMEGDTLIENPEISSIYDQIISLDETLNNGKQSLFEVQKRKKPRVTHPLHLNAFMLS